MSVIWTDQEVSILRRAKVIQHLSYDQIEKLLPGRNKKAIRNKARQMNFVAPCPSRSHVVSGPNKITIPEWVLAERDRRLNAPRTTTQTICGDPPFFQSAL